MFSHAVEITYCQFHAGLYFKFQKKFTKYFSSRNYSNLKPDDVVKYLIELTNAEMVAITNGSKNAILGTKDHVSDTFLKIYYLIKNVGTKFNPLDDCF